MNALTVASALSFILFAFTGNLWWLVGSIAWLAVDLARRIGGRS